MVISDHLNQYRYGSNSTEDKLPLVNYKTGNNKYKLIFSIYREAIHAQNGFTKKLNTLWSNVA